MVFYYNFSFFVKLFLAFWVSPGFAVGAAHEIVGFGVVEDLLLLAIPLEAAPQAKGNHAQQRQHGGAVGSFYVGHRRSLLLYGL